MAAIKDLFKKKKLESKFKNAGPGHRLADSSSGSQASTSSNNPQPPIAAPSQSRPSPPPSAQLEAALARLNTAQRSRNVDWSAANIKAQVKKEMEQQTRADQGNNVRRLDPAPERSHSGKPPMVHGVYFQCVLLGPETGSYEQIQQNIEEYLHSQLSEEPALTSILIIHSCNDASMVQTGVDILSRYLRNIIEHPGEEKYSKIRLQNKAFQERVACLKGGLEFMDATGFKMKDLPNEKGEMESFLVFCGDQDPEKLQDLIESLSSAEPILPQLDRNTQVLAPAVAATHMELPDSFFALSLEELRREQAMKKRKAELLTQMRTSAQRERDEIPHQSRHYSYAVIRIRLPDDNILQGTFSATERLEDVEHFVRDHLADPSLEFTLRGPSGEKLERSLTLAALRLVPAAVVNLHPDLPAVAASGCSLLTPEILARLQTHS